MDADERNICSFLKSWSGQFVSGRDIARRAAGRRRFEREPEWANPVLARLVDKGLLETDSTGHYRFRPPEKSDKNKSRKWVAPHIKTILEKSSKDFSQVYEIQDPDDV
jgi:hypothetical protein